MTVPLTALLEPRPLLPDQGDCAPYPLSALGALLGNAAQAIIEAVQVADALAAQSVLAAAAMAAQPHGNVLRAGHAIPLSLYALSVAESGDRKSSSDRWALLAHQQYQRELIEQYKTDFRIFRDKNDAWQKLRAKMSGSTRGDQDSDSEQCGNLSEPLPPPLPYVLCEEPTLEGVQKSLIQGHPSQGIFSDEGGQFFGGSATRPENLLKTAAGLSKRWDGSPINRTRAAEGESAARYGCRLSAHFMIQPVVATEVLGNSVLQGQGFLARFLIAWPRSLAGSRLYRDSDPSRDPRLLRFWKRMSHLLALETTKDEFGDLSPPALPLEPDALDAWISEHNSIEIQLGPGGAMEEIKPTAAKGAENLLRIAGVFAVVEDRHSIGADLIERAAILVRWYLDEAVRITNPVKVDPQLIDAQRLLDWLRAKSWDRFDARTLQGRGPGYVRKCAKKRDAILRVLVEHSWLCTTDGKNFTLHPAATLETPATTHLDEAAVRCGSVATSCDSDIQQTPLSQLLAICRRDMQLEKPISSGVVADVADVAVAPKSREE